MDSSSAGLFPGRAGLDGGTLPAVPARRWGREWGNDSEAIEIPGGRGPFNRRLTDGAEWPMRISVRAGRQGRLPEGCARLEGEASGRRVVSAWYSAPLRPSGELHAPRYRLPLRRWHGRWAPPADSSLRHAYGGRAPAAFQDSRALPAAGDPSEPLKCWGQWSSVVRPGIHLDAALGPISLWEAGQPQSSVLLEQSRSRYPYCKELGFNLSFTLLLHRHYSRMRDRHTRHLVRVKDL
ncbi:uncharacterized protein LOC142837753 [Microtus pennsylvanicus]|uniref:uncharacterized protein LOC142837753 n=1 Tax=Microtus pennsylvanicus TaxID=10058 RepID=UPI003F6BF0CA